jgi:hypothetical protein
LGSDMTSEIRRGLHCGKLGLDVTPASGDLEADLDRLYGGKAATFVAERNGIAKALRAAGDRTAAAEIAALPRPTPVAWAINQLHFHAKDVLDALRAAGLELRRAQEAALPAEEFAERKRGHQKAVSAATERALAFVEEDGQTPNAGLKRRLEMTLNLFSAAAEDVTPPPGRMSAELEPLGFDALTTVAKAAPRPPPKRAATPEEAEVEKRLASVKAAFDAAEREVRRLEGEAKAARATATRVERDCVEAEERAELARRSRDEARNRAEEAEARVEAARKQVEDARGNRERLP